MAEPIRGAAEGLRMMDQTWRALPVCLLLTPGAAPAAGGEERIGDWAYRSGSGRDGAGFAASADAPGKGSLVFACDAPGPGSVQVSFVAQEYLGGVSAIKRLLQLRVDDGPLVTREWGYAGNVAYDRDHEQALRLARRLGGARTLVLRASTWTFKTVEATIPVGGARQALGRLYRDCGDGDAG